MFWNKESIGNGPRELCIERSPQWQVLLSKCAVSRRHSVCKACWWSVILTKILSESKHHIYRFAHTTTLQQTTSGKTIEKLNTMIDCFKWDGKQCGRKRICSSCFQRSFLQMCQNANGWTQHNLGFEIIKIMMMVWASMIEWIIVKTDYSNSTMIALL